MLRLVVTSSLLLVKESVVAGRICHGAACVLAKDVLAYSIIQSCGQATCVKSGIHMRPLAAVGQRRPEAADIHRPAKDEKPCGDVPTSHLCRDHYLSVQVIEEVNHKMLFGPPALSSMQSL